MFTLFYSFLIFHKTVTNVTNLRHASEARTWLWGETKFKILGGWCGSWDTSSLLQTPCPISSSCDAGAAFEFDYTLPSWIPSNNNKSALRFVLRPIRCHSARENLATSLEDKINPSPLFISDEMLALTRLIGVQSASPRIFLCCGPTTTLWWLIRSINP